MEGRGRTGRVYNRNLPPSPRRLPVAPDTCHLMIQHEQEGALDVEVSGPFHLEAIGLLGGGHPVPLAGRRGADLVTKGVGRGVHTGPSKGPRPRLCPPGLHSLCPGASHLHQVVVRPVQFLVQLNDEALEERRKLPLLFARLGNGHGCELGVLLGSQT